MGTTVEEALQELAGSVSSIVESAVRSAFTAADMACSYWGSPTAGPPGTSERLASVTERFISETRPRYDDGYEAGVAVAETISWSELSQLVGSPWRILRARLGEDAERVLEARWGEHWRARLQDPITARGMHAALSEVWAAVTDRHGAPEQDQ